MDKKLQRGIGEYLSGNLKGAEKLLGEYLAEGGTEKGQAHLYRGLALYDLGHLTEALQELRDAVDAEPGMAVYHYRLGLVYARLMMLADAISELEKALALAPDNQRARYMLGTLLFKQGSLGEAQTVFDSIIAASPDFAAAHHYGGLCRFHAGDTRGAEAAFRKAVEVNPDYVDAWVKLGKLAMNGNRPQEAAEHLGRAFEKGMRDADVLAAFLKALALTGDREQMASVLKEARRLYPSDHEFVRIQDTLS